MHGRPSNAIRLCLGEENHQTVSKCDSVRSAITVIRSDKQRAKFGLLGWTEAV